MRQHLTAALGAALLTVGLVVGVPTALPVGPAAQAAPGRCEPGTGVTVVVDFGGLGGGVPVGCDPSGGGKPASQVISAAGFSVTYVNGQPFVCRVDGKPSAEQESCQRTPPADAYWGLFWSDGTSGWTYSSQGVASLKVSDGGSVGLRWQDGGDREQPGAAPTPAPSPEPEPKPSPKPSATSSSPRPSAAASASADPSGSPTTAGQAPTSAAPTQTRGPSPADRPRKERTPRPSAEVATDVTVSADPSPSATEAVGDLSDAEEVAATDDRGGAWLTWVAAGVLVALTAAVLVVARRRRA